jgi:hypothetical protein
MRGKGRKKIMADGEMTNSSLITNNKELNDGN